MGDVRRTPSSDSDTYYSSGGKNTVLGSENLGHLLAKFHQGSFKIFKLWFIQL